MSKRVRKGREFAQISLSVWGLEGGDLAINITHWHLANLSLQNLHFPVAMDNKDRGKKPLLRKLLRVPMQRDITVRTDRKQSSSSKAWQQTEGQRCRQEERTRQWWEDESLNCKKEPKNLVDRKLTWLWRQAWLESRFGWGSCVLVRLCHYLLLYQRVSSPLCTQSRDSPLQPVWDPRSVVARKNQSLNFGCTN